MKTLFLKASQVRHFNIKQRQKVRLYSILSDKGVSNGRVLPPTERTYQLLAHSWGKGTGRPDYSSFKGKKDGKQVQFE